MSKELEDKFNEATVEIEDLKSRLEAMTKENEELKSEYTWLAKQYSTVVSLIFDDIFETLYRLKHTSLREVLKLRDEEKSKTNS